MKKLFVVLIGFLSFQLAQGWGPIGHRAIGLIAGEHLSKKAKKKITRILEGESLAEVSIWMDDIRSDSKYDHTYSWHWVTIPDGMNYEQAEKNPDGDIIQTIERIVKELKSAQLTGEQEAENIKMLVHLVGDIHQPLHVGTGEDRGGNDVQVKWMRENSNLHRVWDSDMINSQQLSFTELASFLEKPDKAQIAKWQSSSVRDWANESMAYRKQVYDLPEDKSLSYKYRYQNWYIVELRLLQAGIRLAGLLNEIYG